MKSQPSRRGMRPPARIVTMVTAVALTMAGLGDVVLKGSVAPAAYDTAVYMANPMNWNTFVQQCECNYPPAVCNYAPGPLEQWCHVMHPACAFRCTEAEFASRVVERLRLVDPTGVGRVCDAHHHGAKTTKLKSSYAATDAQPPHAIGEDD